jgi:hypothetical protein
VHVPPYIEKIMNGIYRSANVSNHEFRPPVGITVGNQSGRKESDSERKTKRIASVR